jgi:hypothetical protein
MVKTEKEFIELFNKDYSHWRVKTSYKMGLSTAFIREDITIHFSYGKQISDMNSDDYEGIINFMDYLDKKIPLLKTKEPKLGDKAYHREVFEGKEPLRIVGIRMDEVELEGDYSGGVQPVKQKSWMPIKGLIL